MKFRHVSNQQRLTRLWFFASMTLTISMLVKECAGTGNKESFHWSYDLLLSLAAFSLFVASARIYRQERLLACNGFLCAVVVMSYPGRPTF